MRRRDFIAGLGGAVTWPLAVQAQQVSLPVIGYFNSGSPELTASTLAAFRRGLAETGFVEGRNVAFEYRWGYNDPSRLPELAADLVHHHVTVIAALNGSSALAAKAATMTIPVVFFAASDAVEIGLVTNLSRPDGNLTGINAIGVELEGKRLGLLHEFLPRAQRFGVLADPNVPGFKSIIGSVRAAAKSIGAALEVFTASTNVEIDAAFARIANEQVDALAVSTAGLFQSRYVQISALAARYAVPAIGPPFYAEVGGLMSYGGLSYGGSSATDPYRQVGMYTGRVLKGEKPADLPVLQPTKFELVINMRAARALGIEVPPNLLAVADEVIE